MADHRAKLKASKKIDKHLDLARELKKLWNMKVTVIPIEIGALSTVTKGMVQRLEELEIRVEIIFEISQNTEKCSGELRKIAVT